MELKYFVPFKAQEGVDGQFALKEKMLNIEGIAVDDSVNLNKWQIPQEDLDFFVQSLVGAQLRIDHAESAMAVIGKVPEGKRVGNAVTFRAEVGDAAIIEKILRGYLSHVSVQVDSDDVECSKCKRLTRKEGILVHLCPGAYEIVRKPKVRELSIVASPAYKNTTFSPLGFAAAMNDGQWSAIIKSVTNSQLSEDNINGGSKRELQEPDNKNSEEQREVEHLSEHDAQQDASPHKAQVVNVGEGEKAPTQVDYGPFMKQLQDLKQQIYQAESAGSDAEIETLKKQVAALEADLAKKATKRQLSKKLGELSKKMSEEGEEGEKENGEKPTNPVDAVSARKTDQGQGETGESPQHATGKGIVAVDQVTRDAISGPNYDWFNKDLLRAHSQLVGHK